MKGVENVYYVYLHRRSDDNEVFYVGKGRDYRATSVKGRNIYWNRVYEKHGLVVEYLEKNLSEDDAFSLEMETIKFYVENDHTLTNLTHGGEGSSKPTENLHKYYIASEDKHIECTQYRLRQLYKLTPQQASAITAGRNLKGIFLSSLYDKFMNKKSPEVFSFTQIETGEVFHGTMEELITKYSLKPSVRRVANKKVYCPTSQGFILTKNLESFKNKGPKGDKTLYVVKDLRTGEIFTETRRQLLERDGVHSSNICLFLRGDYKKCGRLVLLEKIQNTSADLIPSQL